METSFFVLAFDCSTQSFKVIVMDLFGKIIYQDKLLFCTLDHYNTDNGLYKDGNIVTSPVLMWIEALDILLTRMQLVNFPFHNIKAISGSSQQHTAIYWDNLNLLKNLSSDTVLNKQLYDLNNILQSFRKFNNLEINKKDKNNLYDNYEQYKEDN